MKLQRGVFVSCALFLLIRLRIRSSTSRFAVSYAWGSFDAGRAERGTCPPRLFPEVSIAAGRDAYLTSFVAAPQTALRLLGGTLAMISGAVVRFWAPSCNSLLVSKLLIAKRQPGVGARVSPYFKRSAEMGGWKRAVSPSLIHGGSNQTPRFTTAGAFWGGHVMPSAKPATKLPHA